MSMDYLYSSRNNDTMLLSSNDEFNQENPDSNHEVDVTFFGQFQSPLLDEILNNHQQHMTNNTANTPRPPSPSKAKRARKQRSAGKKDRHSKIHTAQGLRDRRMRLSLHIARKFFGLQDTLGFDKASKTIEWLFSKSKEAIDEVTERVKSQNTTPSACKENTESCESPLSDCDVDSGIEFDAASNKGKQVIKVHDEINDSGSSKIATKSDFLARELRDKARARARERTRERMMINNPKKSKQIFGASPNNDDYDLLQLGFSSNYPNNQYIEDSSSSPNEHSGTYHFLDNTHLNNINAQKTEDYPGPTAASSSTYYSEYGYNKNFANPPAGWLNSSNTFLGFLGGWDSENFTENYGLLPNYLAPLTGDIHGQNFSSVLIPPTNLVHFQTENQRD